MSSIYISGVHPDIATTIYHLNDIRENLYYQWIERKVSSDGTWGDCVLIGIISGTITYSSLTTNAQFFTSSNDTHTFKIVNSNSRWLLVKNTDSTYTFEDMLNDQNWSTMRVYATGTSTYVNIRPIYSNNFISTGNVYLQNQGFQSVNTAFGTMNMKYSDDGSIKLFGLRNQKTISDVTNKIYDLDNLSFNLLLLDNNKSAGGTSRVLITGLTYKETLTFENKKILVFEYPTENGSGQLIISDEPNYAQYAIYPDISLTNLYSLPNDYVPAPLYEGLIDDPYLKESLFTAFTTATGTKITVTNTKYCRKLESWESTAILTITAIGGANYYISTSFITAKDYNLNSLYVTFDMSANSTIYRQMTIYKQSAGGTIDTARVEYVTNLEGKLITADTTFKIIL